jgi:multisubunit Na+/H+ antiporter MnhB subunit
MALVLDIGLALCLVALALFALAARASYSAVAGFVAYGLLLALAWVRLAAADVALTEAAIGSGLTGALLLGAAARLRVSESTTVALPSAARRAMAALLSTLVAVGLAAVVIWLPQPAPTLAHEAAAGLPSTGLGNPVTGVLMSFRGVDTFLEKVVLVLALVGVWSLAADERWGGRPGPRHEADPNGVLAFFARLVIPLGLVIGLYVFWVGANHPGGAFAGGTVVAAMWLLAMMTRLSDTPPIERRALRLALVVGPALFLLVGLAGLIFGGGFLVYPEAYAKPIILAIEVAMTLTVAVTMALLLAGPPQRPADRQ